MSLKPYFAHSAVAVLCLCLLGGTWPTHADNDSRNTELLAHLPLSEIGGGPGNVIGNDCWGWTDAQGGSEYVIFGLTNGVSFVDVTDPYNPGYLGVLPSHTGNATWRDMKVFGNFVYVVSDGNGSHGMQVFDLTRLRTVDPNNPQTFSATAHYAGVTSAHNIAINEDTGYAYIVGSNRANGGLHVLDLNQNPLAPTVVGNFSGDGYTHDCQVVVYVGPDIDYAGREVAFACNADTLTIVDVTNKANMTMVSRSEYPDVGYTHQGWLSEDHRFFFLDDEFDERQHGGPTRTHIFDCLDLDNPVYAGFYEGQTSTVDHNLYIKDGLIYQANYTGGLRVLSMGDPSNPVLSEIAFFDTYDTDNSVTFNGAWSVFPFFDSGTIAVSDRQNGLFLLRLSHAAELSAVTRTLGIYISGGVPELLASDDAYYVLQSGPGFGPSEPHPARADFTFDSAGFPAGTLDIILEEKANIGGPTAVVLLRNRANSAWDELDRFSLSPTDQTFEMTDIPAAEYIGGSGNIRVRVRTFAILVLDPTIRGMFSHDFVGVRMYQ